MKQLKLSDFVKLEIKPFVYGAFLSRTMEEYRDGRHCFYAYTNFRASKYIYADDFPINDYASELINAMNRQSGHHNWELHSASLTNMEARFYVFDDLNWTKSQFYQFLYSKLLQEDWLMSDLPNEEKKSLIRGFMELRGSVDTKLRYIAQDYFYNNRKELKKALLLTEFADLPIQYANFNARELQPQFVSGENKRNTQFRINVFYYAKYIGFVNKYKATVFQNAYNAKNKFTVGDITYFDVEMPNVQNDDVLFVKYLNFFTDNIYQKNLTTATVKQLRSRLGFNRDDSVSTPTRSQSLITLFDEISKDECAVCKRTTTFVNKNTGRQHFEIHHVISFYNGKELDNIANLVKLCPTCHNMLKKNCADKQTQVNAIINILHGHPEVYEFTSSYLQTDDIVKLAEKIQSMPGQTATNIKNKQRR